MTNENHEICKKVLLNTINFISYYKESRVIFDLGAVNSNSDVADFFIKSNKNLFTKIFNEVKSIKKYPEYFNDEKDKQEFIKIIDDLIMCYYDMMIVFRISLINLDLEDFFEKIIKGLISLKIFIMF